MRKYLTNRLKSIHQMLLLKFEVVLIGAMAATLSSPPSKLKVLWFVGMMFVLNDKIVNKCEKLSMAVRACSHVIYFSWKCLHFGLAHTKYVCTTRLFAKYHRYVWTLNATCSSILIAMYSSMPIFSQKIPKNCMLYATANEQKKRRTVR